MPEEQKEILYIAGETREQLENSPYLEAHRAKGADVLLLTDPVDEFVLPSLSYKGKRFQAIDRAESADAGVEAGEKEKYAKLLAHLKGQLPEVADVRLTSRLKESAACLVTEGHLSANLERLMHRWGKGEEAGAAKRVLELNGGHAVVQALLRLFEKDSSDARVEAYGRLLYDQAVIAEGSRVKDPVGLARRINDLLVRDAGG